MKVSKYDYKAGKFNEWNILNDYHCLYILRGDKYFYVGESANVRERMKEHARTKKEDKYNFHTAYIVTDDDSNETVMKLCERLLIMLMRFEKKNVLTNIQKGDKYTFCKNMQEFELKFDKLCFILEKEKIIKAKRFNNVMNIFLLQKNPFRVLNDEQKKTLSSVVRVLESKGIEPADKNYKSRPIFISGGPGTGKTFLAIAFFDYLKKSPFYKDKRIAIVVASPSVRFFIQEIVKAIGYRKKDVIAPVRLTYEKYDIVICDEAQKLRRGVNLNSYVGAFKNGNERLGFDSSYDELDWLLCQSKTLILFYGGKQIVSPSNIPCESFMKRINVPERRFRPVELKKQMRVQAGDEFSYYISDILNEKNPIRKNFSNYTLKLVRSFKELDDIIREKQKKYGFSRRCSGYGFEFKNDGTKDAYKIYIDGCETNWNSTTKDWLIREECIDEIGSIYTLSGLELNYVGVIVSPELYYDKKENKIKMNLESFYDNTVKKQKSADAIFEEILNTYYTLLTRGILGTYIYVCDENLREYFNKFIDY